MKYLHCFIPQTDLILANDNTVAFNLRICKLRTRILLTQSSFQCNEAMKEVISAHNAPEPGIPQWSEAKTAKIPVPRSRAPRQKF